MSNASIPADPHRGGGWSPEFDEGPHHRAQIGCVLVANADLSEADYFAMRPPGVGVHFTRVPMRREVGVAALAAMEHDLAAAAAAMMPGRDDLDVISYSCTSGTFVIGEERVIAQLRRLNPRPRATTMLSACVAALHALGARRIALGTAYTPELTALEVEFLTSKGFDVARAEGLSLLSDAEMNRVTPAWLARFAGALDSPDADALFLSCGALRVLPVIEAIEAAIDKPVVFSNQANFWHCLRLAGIEDRIGGVRPPVARTLTGSVASTRAPTLGRPERGRVLAFPRRAT